MWERMENLKECVECAYFPLFLHSHWPAVLSLVLLPSNQIDTPPQLQVKQQ